MFRHILIGYYAATLVFVALDFGFDVNVRVAFLESAPGIRTGFYGLLFGCFALVLWRPAWSGVVGAVESLVTLSALIINMALRSMMVTDTMLQTGSGFITMPEIINFMIAGSVAYLAWMRGLKALRTE